MENFALQESSQYFNESFDVATLTFSFSKLTTSCLNSIGLISVKLNGTQILQAIDTDITTTQYFGFYTRIDWALDNIAVYDSNGELPIGLMIAGVGIPAVVIALVLIKRR